MSYEVLFITRGLEGVNLQLPFVNFGLPSGLFNVFTNNTLNYMMNFYIPTLILGISLIT